MTPERGAHALILPEVARSTWSAAARAQPEGAAGYSGPSEKARTRQPLEPTSAKRDTSEPSKRSDSAARTREMQNCRVDVWRAAAKSRRRDTMTGERENVRCEIAAANPALSDLTSEVSRAADEARAATGMRRRRLH